MLRAVYAWVCERTGADRLWEALFARRIPEAKGAVAWLYALGSATLFVFVIQAVTGSLLAMNYVPSPDHAYDSVRFIGARVHFGGFVRGLHHWGATFMVVLTALHMLRVFWMGAYKYPREGTWLAGVALFLLVLLFSFTGYLLPWDQKAYWATLVGANIAGQTPLIGPYLARVLLGGPEMGAATLSRFYALHVLVLPALTGGALLVHLFLVVWHGISEPPGRAAEPSQTRGWAPVGVSDWHAAYRERYKKLKEGGEPFFPYAVFKDTLVAAVLLAGLSYLAWTRGAGLEELADPTDNLYNPRPEWYFLFLFQALKFFPGRLESVAAIVLPGLAVVLLVLVPFLDRGPLRHPLDRKPWTALGLLAFGGFAALTWAGYRSPLTNPIVEKDPVALEGQRLYRTLNCSYCHVLGGRGGRLGPNLDRVLGVREEGWLAHHLKNPQAVSAMPKLNLLDDEIKALVGYLGTMGGGPYSAEAPKLFAENCAACHRIKGEGGDGGPDLSLIGSARDKTFIKKYTEDPSKLNASSSMPGYSGQLTETQLEDLARYLSSLR